jgi:polyisoprenoid-binding protein YceI
VIVIALIGVAVLGFLWISGGSGEPSGAALADNSLSVTLTARASAAEPTAAAEMEATEEAEPTEAAEMATEAAEMEATEETQSEAAEATDEATMEATEEAEPTAEATEMAEATEVAVSAAAEATEEATMEATEEATMEATAEATDSASASAGAEAIEAGIFSIVGEESEVSFELTEDLRGQFTVVRGVTQEVGGQIFVDFAAPANSEAGVIRINARTLATDNEFRNRAIRGQILLSAQDEFEFIEFTPTGLEGLPEQVGVGQEVTFQLVGDLVIKGITQPVTFDVTLTPVTADRLEGTAITVVQRAMYELNIPNVPGVANVSEDVTLTLNFVAVRG